MYSDRHKNQRFKSLSLKYCLYRVRKTFRNKDSQFVLLNWVNKNLVISSLAVHFLDRNLNIILSSTKQPVAGMEVSSVSFCKSQMRVMLSSRQNLMFRMWENQVFYAVCCRRSWMLKLKVLAAETVFTANLAKLLWQRLGVRSSWTFSNRKSCFTGLLILYILFSCAWSREFRT